MNLLITLLKQQKSSITITGADIELIPIQGDISPENNDEGKLLFKKAQVSHYCHTQQKTGLPEIHLKIPETPVFTAWYRREDLNLHALRH